MEHQGRLTQWNDARGFGFITPLSGGPRVFVHISAFQQRHRRPRLHDQLTYVISVDEQGRLRANRVRSPGHIWVESENRKGISAAMTMAALIMAAMVVVVLGIASISFRSIPVSPNPSLTQSSTAAADTVLSNAYQAQQSGVQVGGEGVVERVLSDDTSGSRHQRMILRLASGQTLLIAHNIDIAPRIAALMSGDPIAFYGQYEWNAEGGVIHWTHRDPNGQHVAGWLKHNGMIYQ